jgi:predicted metal-dependent enzyme (double-stranded beta helix superfamily)
MRGHGRTTRAGLDPAPLRDFVQAMTRLVESGVGEDDIRAEGTARLQRLLASEHWLDERFRRAGKEGYRQYLLYGDPLERFSVVSFVWGPGQSTPVHDHTVWGLVGMYEGAETSTRYHWSRDGQLKRGDTDLLEPGMVDFVSPASGDIHQVANAYGDRISISIHVYGANIGRVRRHVFDEATGATREFVSGYASDVLPSLW